MKNPKLDSNYSKDQQFQDRAAANMGDRYANMNFSASRYK